jgi:hypothetical protein
MRNIRLADGVLLALMFGMTASAGVINSHFEVPVQGTARYIDQPAGASTGWIFEDARGIASTGLGSLAVAIPAAGTASIPTTESDIDLKFGDVVTGPEDLSITPDTTTAMTQALPQAPDSSAKSERNVNFDGAGAINASALTMPLSIAMAAAMCLVVSCGVVMTWRKSLTAAARPRKLNPRHWAVYR